MSRPLKLGLLILAIVSLILLFNFLTKAPLELISSTFSFSFSDSSRLERIVSQNLEGKKGDYAIYIEDLADAESFSLRGSDRFPAASLYKIFLIAGVLEEVEKGDLRMDEVVSADMAHLEEVFGGIDFGYEETPETIEYTVEEALTRVGRISDNFAAIMLAEKIGWGKVQAAADKLGAKNTTIKNPISTSAVDIAKFFKLLYQKQVGSENISNQIIELLALSKINDRIPAGINQVREVGEVRVIHKTGELSRLRHDAGIVILPQQPEQPQRAYVIVLMSQNLKYEDEGVETLASISKDVYSYFEKKYNNQ